MQIYYYYFIPYFIIITSEIINLVTYSDIVNDNEMDLGQK